MHWVTAVQYARYQPDVSFEEWCDLYYNHSNPTPEQIEKASKTARIVLDRNDVINSLIRNGIINENDTEFYGMNDSSDTWPRRDDPNPN